MGLTSGGCLASPSSVQVRLPSMGLRSAWSLSSRNTEMRSTSSGSTSDKSPWSMSMASHTLLEIVDVLDGLHVVRGGLPIRLHLPAHHVDRLPQTVDAPLRLLDALAVVHDGHLIVRNERGVLLKLLFVSLDRVLVVAKLLLVLLHHLVVLRHTLLHVWKIFVVDLLDCIPSRGNSSTVHNNYFLGQTHRGVDHVKAQGGLVGHPSGESQLFLGGRHHLGQLGQPL